MPKSESLLGREILRKLLGLLSLLDFLGPLEALRTNCGLTSQFTNGIILGRCELAMVSAAKEMQLSRSQTELHRESDSRTNKQSGFGLGNYS